MYQYNYTRAATIRSTGIIGTVLVGIRTVTRVLWVLGIVGLVYRRLVSSAFGKYWYVWFRYYTGYSMA